MPPQVEPVPPPREKPAEARTRSTDELGLASAWLSAAGSLAGAGVALAVASATGAWPAGLAAAALFAVVLGVHNARARRDAQRLLARLVVLSESARSRTQIVPLETAGLGSLARLGERVNQLLSGLGELAGRVRGLMDRVYELPEELGQALGEVADSAEAQEEAVEEAASLLANINGSICDIDDQVERLSRSADESASSILEMSSAVDEVARNVGTLYESVEGASSTVHQMGASIQQVASGTDAVRRMAESSAASMLEMDRSVQEVGENAKDASALAERVRDGAEQGSAAVSATIEDIQLIHDVTGESRRVLERLVGRIREISEILGTMREINDETNLLSLNAAIIAAQAGEQGKAFLVVANHVKTLSRRTASSTEAIEMLVSSVHAESDEAVEAMRAGSLAIEQGVSRSRVAGDALASIRSSAADSSACVSEIARATAEQSQGSRLVSQAAQETSAQVHHISAAIQQQSAASQTMLSATMEALELCRHVHRSTDEQRETGRHITQAISSITEMIHNIRAATAAHARASESVSETVTTVLSNAQKGASQVPRAQEVLRELQARTDAVRAELSRL